MATALDWDWSVELTDLLAEEGWVFGTGCRQMVKGFFLGAFMGINEFELEEIL